MATIVAHHATLRRPDVASVGFTQRYESLASGLRLLIVHVGLRHHARHRIVSSAAGASAGCYPNAPTSWVTAVLISRTMPNSLAIGVNISACSRA